MRWEGEGGKSILTSSSRYFYSESHASSKDSHIAQWKAAHSFLSGGGSTNKFLKMISFTSPSRAQTLCPDETYLDPDLMTAQTYAIGIGDTLGEVIAEQFAKTNEWLLANGVVSWGQE